MIRVLFVSLFCTVLSIAQVQTGADLLITHHSDLIAGKRIGLITNHTGLLSNGVHLADALKARPDLSLTALFGPEHGIRGIAPDGKSIADAIDKRTGVKVYSLYGAVTKPTPAMLKDVDVLIFDIQDVGARFYTFISTLFLAMEAAGERHIPFIVLDRPNPIGGLYCDGPIRLDSLASFVGWAPMPIAHGMTVGELAEMANGEGWLKNAVKVQLTVVKMEGWKRRMTYDETSLAWVSPSPNMRTVATALVYPGTCLIEGTNVSEGRGTERPFETIGAPWMNGDTLAAFLNAQHLPGVAFERTAFIPHETALSSPPKFTNVECSGVILHVLDKMKFSPVTAGVAVVSAIHALYPSRFTFTTKGFDRLTGTPVVRTMILAGRTTAEIAAWWQPQVETFSKKRLHYLLYN